MARTGNNYEKWLWGDNTINIQVELWFLGSALSLIAIYLYTKFDLNANSSFKVIFKTRYHDGQTDGQSDDIGEHNNWYYY